MYLNHSSQKEIRFLNALGDDLIAAQRGYLCYGLVIEICHIASEFRVFQGSTCVSDATIVFVLLLLSHISHQIYHPISRHIL